MSILRTDNEADGVEILKLVIETTHYYREMANVLKDEPLTQTLESIANERATYIEPFQNLVKQLDELPAPPDPDKELIQKIGGELRKLFSADSKNAILDKCLHEDEKLAEEVKNTKLGEKSAEFEKLINALDAELNKTKALLQTLKD